MMRSLLPAALALTALLGTASCAPGPAGPTVTAAGQAAPVDYGVIVAVRPVPQPISGRAAGPRPGDRPGDVRATILAAVADTPAAADAAPAPGQPTIFEFIIRRDDGQTLSVVQANHESLRPGERVALASGARTRLSRAPR
jgi:outer membrane lipoprotein SlyB